MQWQVMDIDAFATDIYVAKEKRPLYNGFNGKTSHLLQLHPEN